MPYFVALMFAWLIIALVPWLSQVFLVHGGAGIFQFSPGG